MLRFRGREACEHVPKRKEETAPTQQSNKFGSETMTMSEGSCVYLATQSLQLDRLHLNVGISPQKALS